LLEKTCNFSGIPGMFPTNILDFAGHRSYYNPLFLLKARRDARKGASMKKSIVFPFVLLAVLSGCVSQDTFDLKSKELDDMSSKKSDLDQQVQRLTADLDAQKRDHASVQAEKDALQADKDAALKERDSLQRDKSEALKEIDALQSKISELTEKANKAEQLEKTTQTYEDLTKKLEQEIQQGQVQITEMKNRLTMTLVDKILFRQARPRSARKASRFWTRS
jgi:hypothetical protein